MQKTASDNPASGTTEDRYEIKYVVRQSALPSLHAWLRGHPAGFVAAYPPRIVNNIYFDSANWSNLNCGLAGIAERAKLRLRWYGNGRRPSQLILEHKQKRGWVGRKLSRTLEHVFEVTQCDRNTLVQRIASAELGPLAPVLATACCPVLLNRYRREYYRSGDHRVRLTLDTDLKFYDLTRYRGINDRFPEPALDVMVVELKAATEQAQQVAEVAGHFPFRATAFSKFTVGLLGLSHAF